MILHFSPFLPTATRGGCAYTALKGMLVEKYCAIFNILDKLYPSKGG